MGDPGATFGNHSLYGDHWLATRTETFVGQGFLLILQTMFNLHTCPGGFSVLIEFRFGSSTALCYKDKLQLFAEQACNRWPGLSQRGTDYLECRQMLAAPGTSRWADAHRVRGIPHSRTSGLTWRGSRIKPDRRGWRGRKITRERNTDCGQSTDVRISSPE
ncbi:hypothetical protein ElyMa_001543700 [Elysia marginata]|uniref:Uncharacterized protein n=1 Tax=Elysia marginata TaxID=1093978 RepID=A0AAV4JDB1_9GAST|nr:hypothetical protein ElyMa_001543700 [Elysia marginata]